MVVHGNEKGVWCGGVRFIIFWYRIINQKGNKSKNAICYLLFEQYLRIHGLIWALLKPAFLLQFLYAKPNGFWRRVQSMLLAVKFGFELKWHIISENVHSIYCFQSRLNRIEIY